MHKYEIMTPVYPLYLQRLNQKETKNILFLIKIYLPYNSIKNIHFLYISRSTHPTAIIVHKYEIITKLNACPLFTTLLIYTMKCLLNTQIIFKSTFSFG